MKFLTQQVLEMTFNGIRFPGLLDLKQKPEPIDVVSIDFTQKPKPKFERGTISLLGLSIELLDVSWNDTSLKMRVNVPDRRDGLPLGLTFDVEFAQATTEEQLAEMIVKAIANVIAHEVAEMLFVRGRRLDPHARKPFFDGASEPLPKLEFTRSETERT